MSGPGPTCAATAAGMSCFLKMIPILLISLLMEVFLFLICYVQAIKKSIKNK